jgi:hypothetical protein
MPASREGAAPAPPTYLRFLPEIILTVMGTLLMVLDPLSQSALRSSSGTLHRWR